MTRWRAQVAVIAAAASLSACLATAEPVRDPTSAAPAGDPASAELAGDPTSAAPVGDVTSAAPVEDATAAVEGATDGIWFWRLPPVPKDLRAIQSWSATGAAPNGDIYIAGMDHATNAALYRLHRGRLRYVGDARSASQAVDNWAAGEVVSKIHTRPTWHRGRVYVATHSNDLLDDGYLSQRGFHWYAYDVGEQQFLDLSAAQPGGTGAPHGGLVSLALDPTNRRLYGASHPTGDIVRYDIGTGTGEVLGHPDYQRDYVYPSRMMWVDRRGRLYFSAGNAELGYYGAPYDPAIFNHIYYYDPATGFGALPDWQLHDQRAIDVGQCFRRAGVCYVADNLGHVYRFDEAGPSWDYLGDLGLTSWRDQGFVWVFQVTADQSLAYLATSDGFLYELDLTSGAAQLIVNLKEIEPRLANLNVLNGFDAWDRQGRFYFAAFANNDPNGPRVLLTAIDPVRLKAALAHR